MTTINPILLVVIAFLVFVALIVPISGKILNHFITVVHEMGHAVTTLLLGGRVGAIRVEMNGSGSTTSGHPVTSGYKLARISTLLSGYSFPVYLGLGLVAASILQNQWLSLILLGVVCFLSLLFIRNLFGFIIIVLFSSASFLPLLVPNLTYSYVSFALGLILFFGGLKDILLITRAMFSSHLQSSESDFDLLQTETHIHRAIWVIIFFCVQILAIAGVAFLASQLLMS